MAVLVLVKFSKVSALVVRAFGNFTNQTHRTPKGEFFKKRKDKNKMQKFYLTFFYSGLSKFAPGTCGTAAALVPAFLVLRYLSVETLFLLSMLIFCVSVKIIDDYERSTHTHDSSHIVIDEVAGLFLTASLIAWVSNSLFSLMLAFVLFRFFDITKPSIIGKVDKKVSGGLGVMGDDMLAGLFAGLLGAIIYGVGLKFELLSWDIELSKLF